MPLVFVGFVILFTALMPMSYIFALLLHTMYSGDFRHVSPLFSIVSQTLFYVPGVVVVSIFMAKSNLRARLPSPIPGMLFLLSGSILALLPMAFIFLKIAFQMAFPNVPIGLVLLGYIEHTGMPAIVFKSLVPINSIAGSTLLIVGAVKVLLSAKPENA